MQENQDRSEEHYINLPKITSTRPQEKYIEKTNSPVDRILARKENFIIKIMRT